MPKRGQRLPKPPVGDPSDARGFARLLDLYLADLRISNYSERTIRVRDNALRRFIRWGEDRGLLRPVEITRPILERYKRHLYFRLKADGKPLSFSAQVSSLGAVKAFFKWLAKKDYILWNPASELDLPRQPYRLPRAVLSEREAEQILALPDLETLLGVRDRAILETLYSTGIRRLELLSLKLQDVDPDRGTLFIREGKGKKDRLVPIGERALAWIERYLREVRPELATGADEGALFLTLTGLSLTPSLLTHTVRRYVDQADLGKTGACHLFRHTCATLMLEGGADVRYIQELLGHAKLDTTQIYTRVSIRRLKEVHQACHPASKSPWTSDPTGTLPSTGA